jgi:hypothetical protein
MARDKPRLPRFDASLRGNVSIVAGNPVNAQNAAPWPRIEWFLVAAFAL